ncbi:aminomethyl transferase family protein [Oceanicola granulosus HTCC2516]|uniref:Aminomethyl transferase family protein n=1 Tax=Oceanicola granulosus (strain ATCC BAA-861 / DSM 15982 / KCTC 12143 / HTCC2516) TaxID=314256 RepID=Q2CAB5_OCEGH|nr:folate-binding protein YgfZ [Oceanicola granulosus]EAR49603.1 aminomethyl transferase family protein [Oceanicola granulosus HTCC2516]
MSDRTIFELTGSDRVKFLDNLVTNNVPAPGDGLRYAALLTPQGKYIADFFLLAEPERLLIDAPAVVAPALAQRLSMYRLRADVALAEIDLAVRRGTGPAPEGAFADPRHPALGWRLYGTGAGDDGTDFDALRVEHVVPEAGRELDGDSYVLEMGFERLNGVDFRKGCYVGQEVTARMKHKTDLRKGLARVRLEGAAEPGTEIVSDGRSAGILHTVCASRGLAYVRYDRATGRMTAGDARVYLS